MKRSRPISAQGDHLNAQASAFAQLLGLAPNDLDGAYRQAVALGDAEWAIVNYDILSSTAASAAMRAM